MTALQQQRFNAIVHVVHEYANFVSSAEMVLSGCDIDGVPFKPPINAHVNHAFYLNCRKLADLFQNKLGRDKDDIMAEHYVPSFYAALPISTKWRVPMNKQLAHVTYAPRDTRAREIDRSACEALYTELKDTWRKFRKGLVGGLYEAEFKNQVRKRKEPYPNGRLSEFRFYDLDLAWVRLIELSLKHTGRPRIALAGPRNDEIQT
jgi:hypothetical protein